MKYTQPTKQTMRIFWSLLVIAGVVLVAGSWKGAFSINILAEVILLIGVLKKGI